MQAGGFLPRHLQDLAHPIREVVAVHPPPCLTPARSRAPAAHTSRAPWATPGHPSGDPRAPPGARRSEEHTSELQSLAYLVCRLLLEKKKNNHHAYVLRVVVVDRMLTHQQKHIKRETRVVRV